MLPPCDRLRRRRPYPYYRATRQAAIPLSHILPTVLYLSVALGICCFYDSVLFQLHSLSLSPLDYLSDILCRLYKYILYSSEPYALLVNRIRIAGRDHSGSDRGYTTFYTTTTGTVQSRHPKELTTAKLYRVGPIVMSRVNPIISLLLSALSCSNPGVISSRLIPI